MRFSIADLKAQMAYTNITSILVRGSEAALAQLMSVLDVFGVEPTQAHTNRTVYHTANLTVVADCAELIQKQFGEIIEVVAREDFVIIDAE